MLPSIVYDLATLDDTESLVALRIEAMRESLERIGRFDPSRARERFLSSFEPEFTRHITIDCERVGFVVVKPRDHGLLLDHLYVRPQHQSKGIGTAVIAHIFTDADKQGIGVRVGALRGSTSNAFYVRHGFVLVNQDEYDNYYVRPKQAPL